MAKKDLSPIVTEVLKHVGGDENVKSFTNCQTRLRINVSDISKVDKAALQKTEGALGVNITGEQVQVIYGPGKVVEFAEAFSKVTTAQRGEAVDASREVKDLKDVAAEVKAKTKSHNTSGFQRFIGKFAGIFAPMIIGFIGAGILAGIAGILQASCSDMDGTLNGIKTGYIAVGGGYWSSMAAFSWFKLLSMLMDIWKGIFLVIVGWRTAEVFGGSGVIGAIIAGLYVGAYAANVTGVMNNIPGTAGSIDFLGVTYHGDIAHNWLFSGFRPSFNGTSWSFGYPSGSVFGVMMSAGIVGLIEKGFRTFIPSVIDSVATPTLTLFTLLMLNFVLIIPVSGYVFTAISFMFTNLYGNPFGGALLAGLFLGTVVLGVHQGFVPVYAALLTATGVNALYPILAMAGAGQVGMAMALWVRADKNSVLRKQIQGAIIPGFLGIGEPLIYGVSLPRVKPFITACIGGAMAGFFLGAMNLWVEPIGVLFTGGPSGLIILPLMTTAAGNIGYAISMFAIALAIAYAGGFATTYFFGHKNVDLA